LAPNCCTVFKKIAENMNSNHLVKNSKVLTHGVGDGDQLKEKNWEDFMLKRLLDVSPSEDLKQQEI
jgi:hypothetical protein